MTATCGTCFLPTQAWQDRMTKSLRTRSLVRTNVEYVIAWALLSCLGRLSWRHARILGECFGRLAYSLSHNLRRTGRLNLELVFPDKTEAEKRSILRGCFRNLGRLMGNFSQFGSSDLETLRQMVDCHGLENLQSLNGRGVILFTGHLGNWELTSFGLSVRGHPLSFLVRRIDNPKVEKMIEQVRTRFGNRTIDKRSSIRPGLRLLNNGGTLGMLLDVNMMRHEGVFVDFLGTPASTTYMAAKLALRTGAELVPVFAPWREELRRYVVEVGPPVKFEPTGDADADVFELTRLATEVVEGYVKRYADQWLWIHKRWRTRPEGFPDVYGNERARLASEAPILTAAKHRQHVGMPRRG